MYDKMIELNNFLKSVEEFYAPKNPFLKDGVGHENEHIKGVITRSAQMCDVINNNPEIFGYKLEKHIAATIACLHDIGNVISRNMHNFLGEGIFNGEVTAKHIVKHSYGEFNKRDREKLSKIVDSIEMNEIDFYNIPEKFKGYLIEAYATVVRFHMGVYGFNGKSVTEEDFDDFAYSVIQNSQIVSLVRDEMIDNETGLFKYDETKYVPQLERLVREFDFLFPKNSPNRKVILAAIREHNIDFELNKNGVENRFVSEHKYSRLIADADKDNVPETFAIRTMLFAKNKLGVVNQKFMLQKNGEQGINVSKCLLHVPHQARERFGYSRAEWRKISGDKKAQYQPIFEDAIIEYDNENGYKKLEKAKFYDKKTKGISPNPGDDIFSQQEQYVKEKRDITTRIISALRAPAVEKCRQWSRVDMLPQTLSEMQQIYDKLMESPSVETAVDYYEALYYHQSNRDFSTVVFDALRDTKPTLSVMRSNTEQFLDTVIEVDMRDIRAKGHNPKEDRIDYKEEALLV